MKGVLVFADGHVEHHETEGAAWFIVARGRPGAAYGERYFRCADDTATDQMTRTGEGPKDGVFVYIEQPRDVFEAPRG